MHRHTRARPGAARAARIRRATHLALALSLLGSGCTHDSRVFRRSTWELLWRIGGIQGDTVLVTPTNLYLAGGRLLVLDPGGPKVLAFNKAGSLAWSFGRQGSGPGELRNPVGIAVQASGDVMIADAELSRFALVDTLGRLIRTIAFQGFSGVTGICSISSSKTAVMSYESTAPLLVLSEDGSARARADHPFKALRGLPPQLQSAVLTEYAPASNCVIALQQGDGMGVLDSAGHLIAAWPYIESVPASTSPDRTRLDYNIPKQEAPYGTKAARSASVSDTFAYVVFGGTSQYGGRVIDVYNLRRSAYQFSLLPPADIRSIAALVRSRDTVFVYHGINGVPVVSAYRVAMTD